MTNGTEGAAATRGDIAIASLWGAMVVLSPLVQLLKILDQLEFIRRHIPEGITEAMSGVDPDLILLIVFLIGLVGMLSGRALPGKPGQQFALILLAVFVGLGFWSNSRSAYNGKQRHIPSNAKGELSRILQRLCHPGDCNTPEVEVNWVSDPEARAYAMSIIGLFENAGWPPVKRVLNKQTGFPGLWFQRNPNDAAAKVADEFANAMNMSINPMGVFNNSPANKWRITVGRRIPDPNKES